MCSCGFEDILTKIGEKTYKSYKDIDFSKLPDKCVIKCNHTSGCNALFDRSKVFDYKKFRREFAYWLHRDYFWESREYNYKGIEPKIFYEYFIEAPEKAGLIDYRFMCFNGKVKFLLVDINTMDVGGGGTLQMPSGMCMTESLICFQSKLQDRLLTQLCYRNQLIWLVCLKLLKNFQNRLSIAV